MKNESLRRNYISDVALDQERLLVERIRDGDQSALEELIRQYGGKIYYLALQYTRNPQDAEEVLQDVFLKVFRKIDTFRAAARLSPWLYKIAVNTSLMKLREQKKHRVTATVSLEDWMLAGNSEAPDAAWEVQLADWSADAQQLLLREELQETVRRAIGRLPEIYRTVVQLRDIDGLTLEEISDALGISIPAVKSRLHRARLIIQKTISRFMAQENRKRLLSQQN
ncbi:MAG: sigma-70 family RNA polymerase sigma factor [Acidobacteria bacterium]|nr:sigma-70 family RNA polymerase sigma factor [Acidobacteriota bacterium]